MNGITTEIQIKHQCPMCGFAVAHAFGEDVEITNTEAKILAVLLAYSPETVPYEMLTAAKNRLALKVHISKLRDKLAHVVKLKIGTEKRCGYWLRLRPEAEVEGLLADA